MRTAVLIGLLEIVLAVAPLAAGDQAADNRPADNPVQFDRDIAPIFKRHCVKCHGPAKQEAQLNLSSVRGVIRGGKSGGGVVPHDVASSLVWQKIDADEMPPEAPLSAQEKSIVKRWIAGGTAGLTADGPEDLEHWSFRRLKVTSVPMLNAFKQYSAIVATSPIDAFVLADLTAEGLSFLPEADRHSLIRRISFDLIGLPPSPTEIEQFVSDDRPDAFSRMVDRFLASPHFGERLGKVWLDAAGYADSNGYFNADTDRPLAYRYRDYVIRSLNGDKPFTDFLREQIAGDELAQVQAKTGDSIVLPWHSTDGSASAERVMELWDATHFLRNGQDGTGESDGNPDELRVDRYTVLETAMQNISTAVLGLTIQCAKCHDHKFEPLTQRDFYSFQAVLIPAFPPEQWKKPNERFVYLTVPGELEAWKARVAEADTKVASLQADYTEWAKANRLKGVPVFSDSFDGTPESLLSSWSGTAPGDDKPGGTPPVNLNSRTAPAAVITDGRLQLIEGANGSDKWLVTAQSFDWTPDLDHGAIQVTFDLVDNRVDNSAPADRIGYFIAAHDFHHDSQVSGGNILIDGHPSQGSAVHLNYPGVGSRSLGILGKTGYAPGHNYGVRISRTGKGKFLLQHLVDGQVEEPSLKVTEADLPKGGFGFEYCCGRSFVVDNVVVETFTPRDGIDPIAQHSKDNAPRRKSLDEALKVKTALQNSQPGKIAWSTDVVDPPPAVHVLERGNYGKPAEPVDPAGFTVLSESSANGAQATHPRAKPDGLKSSGRRLDFANWLTEPGSKPASLMSRVQMNRLWQHHFGIGLVATADNLGQSGAVPSHPELLEWLSREFGQADFRSKRLVRQIVSSMAYRQSSWHPAADDSVSNSPGMTSLLSDERWRKDPDGRRLSRFPVRRLDAEAIRDMLLAASCDLDDRLYGPYVPTSRTESGETVVAETDPGARRRSIYLQQKRTQVHSLLQVFDAPSIVFNSIRRARSTMPLQSLSLLNSDFIVARAMHLAERLELDSDNDARFRSAFLLTSGRPPTKDQLQAGAEFVQAQAATYADQASFSRGAWTDLCQMLLIQNAALYLE